MRTRSPVGDVLFRGVGGVDGEDVLGDDAGVAGAAGHGAAVVVLQHAAGGEDEGEFAVVLHDFARFLEAEEVELAEAALEGVGVEDFGADAAFLDGPLLAVVAEFFPHGAFEKRDDAGDFGEDAVGRVVGLRDAHAVHDVHDDLAVGLRAGERRDDFVHALHAALAIGEGAALFKERCAGQHDVGELRGL